MTETLGIQILLRVLSVKRGIFLDDPLAFTPTYSFPISLYLHTHKAQEAKHPEVQWYVGRAFWIERSS